MLEKVYKWLAGVALVLALCIGSYFYGTHNGKLEQVAVQAVQTEKANVKTVEKSEASQDVADKADAAQIIYKDRIVTKYQTITKEVVKYVETKDAAVGLDPEFVRLHDAAASANDQLSIAGSSSGADGQAGVLGVVTTGDAIQVITRNYQRANSCIVQVTGWQEFYTNLQKTVNDNQTNSK